MLNYNEVPGEGQTIFLRYMGISLYPLSLQQEIKSQEMKVTMLKASIHYKRTFSYSSSSKNPRFLFKIMHCISKGFYFYLAENNKKILFYTCLIFFGIYQFLIVN